MDPKKFADKIRDLQKKLAEEHVTALSREALENLLGELVPRVRGRVELLDLTGPREVLEKYAVDALIHINDTGGLIPSAEQPQQVASSIREWLREAIRHATEVLEEWGSAERLAQLPLDILQELDVDCQQAANELDHIASYAKAVLCSKGIPTDPLK